MASLPDFTRLTWQFNIAIIGATFAVFALIYNEYYIYYGLYTFLLGVMLHLCSNLYDTYMQHKRWGLSAFFITHLALIVGWLWVLLIIYC